MMTLTDASLPPVVSRDEWLAARRALLAKEKAGDWEEPAGRSDGPFMHWVRRHDRYGPEAAARDPAEFASTG